MFNFRPNLPNGAFPSYPVPNVPTLGAWEDDFQGSDYSASFVGTLDTAAPGVADAVAAETAGGMDWISALSKVIQTYVMADSQKQYLAANLELARAGKPPLDASNYGLGVSVGMDANTRKMVTWAVAGALAIAGLAVYNSNRRAR